MRKDPILKIKYINKRLNRPKNNTVQTRSDKINSLWLFSRYYLSLLNKVFFV